MDTILQHLYDLSKYIIPKFKMGDPKSPISYTHFSNRLVINSLSTKYIDKNYLYGNFPLDECIMRFLPLAPPIPYY